MVYAPGSLFKVTLDKSNPIAARHTATTAAVWFEDSPAFEITDASKAKAKLGWVPTTSFDELVRMMVEHDLEMAKREKTLRDAGHKVGTSDYDHGH